MELNRRDRERLLWESWGDRLGRLPFLSEEQAAEANREQRQRLAALGQRVSRHFGGSKLATGPLSPGCQACGNGTWSCLFITRQCQASCFTCPAFKSSAEMAPYADGLEFRRFEDFLDYCASIGINGVAFSGGDPLLFADRLVDLIVRLRRSLGTGIYLWAYTNGLCANRKVLESLARAGLDEIRFNIGATGYSLDKVALAKGILPRVTVEIACVPEDVPILKGCMKEMAAVGVDHLNLHQIMLSSANLEALVDRGYHVTRQAVPSVVESELAMLELMEHALDQGIHLAINHCNTSYKGRWQQRGSFLRINKKILAGHESETESGYIRRLWFTSDARKARKMVQALLALPDGVPQIAPEPADGLVGDPQVIPEPVDTPNDVGGCLWDGNHGRLYFPLRLFPQAMSSGMPIYVQYHTAGLAPDVIVTQERRILTTAPGKYLSVLVSPASEVIELDDAGRRFLGRIADSADLGGEGVELPYELARYECIGSGVPDYD
ncbi:MAG: 4Fe-4S cluster-binding domain-containing protein [Bradymonadales bacterium]|nr:4Fe-4S cluster-binding domain-containing protein [Bradymonadales bacterium]